MNRRLLILSLAATLSLVAPSAHAQTAQEQVVQQLTKQGFSRITVKRTFLGRIRILADGTAGRREIVLNPATGTILRDYFEREHDDDHEDRSGQGSGQDDRRDDRAGTDNRGSGSGDRDDDNSDNDNDNDNDNSDDDKDKDDDDDSDESGDDDKDDD